MGQQNRLRSLTSAKTATIVGPIGRIRLKRPDRHHDELLNKCSVPLEKFSETNLDSGVSRLSTTAPGIPSRQHWKPVIDHFAQILMAFRPMTTMRNAATAVVLLVIALLGVEFWLQRKSMPTMQGVTSRATAADQRLLVPSAVCHHELQRMLKTVHQASPASGNHDFRVNSFGCRGEEPEVPAPEGSYRILVLGDDSICGTGVDEHETVSAHLQRFLSKQTKVRLEVINCGIPGYCPLLSWLKFEHDLIKLKPDLVILHIDMTDIADDLCYRSLLMSENNHAVCAHPTLRLKPQKKHAIAEFVKQSATASWLFAMARDQGPKMLSMSSVSSNENPFDWITDDLPDIRLQVSHALEPITRLKAAVEASGGRFLVTTAPVLWQVVSADNAPQLSRRCRIRGKTPYRRRFPFEVLQKLCSHTLIRFCDASPTFETGKDAEKLFSTESPVLSRIGTALYAREIARYIITNPPADW